MSRHKRERAYTLLLTVEVVSESKFICISIFEKLFDIMILARPKEI